MKIGQFISEDEMARQGWEKLVKYGSISYVYTKENIGLIRNDIDGQIIRILDATEIKQIVELWDYVQSVVYHTK
jgi:hypothetical protein